MRMDPSLLYLPNTVCSLIYDQMLKNAPAQKGLHAVYKQFRKPEKTCCFVCGIVKHALVHVLCARWKHIWSMDLNTVPNCGQNKEYSSHKTHSQHCKVPIAQHENSCDDQCVFYCKTYHCTCIMCCIVGWEHNWTMDVHTIPNCGHNRMFASHKRPSWHCKYLISL